MTVCIAGGSALNNGGAGRRVISTAHGRSAMSSNTGERVSGGVVDPLHVFDHEQRRARQRPRGDPQRRGASAHDGTLGNPVRFGCRRDIGVGDEADERQPWQLLGCDALNPCGERRPATSAGVTSAEPDSVRNSRRNTKYGERPRVLTTDHRDVRKPGSAADFVDQPRLARPRITGDLDDAAVAGACALTTVRARPARVADRRVPARAAPPLRRVPRDGRGRTRRSVPICP